MLGEAAGVLLQVMDRAIFCGEISVETLFNKRFQQRF